jgi:hypothetical protein
MPVHVLVQQINRYIQQINLYIRVLSHARDPRSRLATLERLYRIYIRMSRYVCQW